MTTTMRVRLRFAKRGDLRLVSHHDLMRCVERMVRRAEIPVAHSQGFNPRPKLVFALALALGIEGYREVLEIELAEPMESGEVLRRLREVSPAGLEWSSIEVLSTNRPSQALSTTYEIRLPSDRRAAAQAALDRFLACESWPFIRKRPDRGTEVAVDLRTYVEHAEIDPVSVLRVQLTIKPSGSARPEEILQALEVGDLLQQGVVLARSEMELAS